MLYGAVILGAFVIQAKPEAVTTFDLQFELHILFQFHFKQASAAIHGTVRAVVPVPFCGAHHERPLHLYHARHIRAHDRGVPDDLRRPDPPRHPDEPGLGLHRAELPEIAVRPGLPGVFDHGVRGNLRRAGADDLNDPGHFGGDMVLHGVHGPSVFRPVQDRQPVKIPVRGALRRIDRLAYVTVPKDLTKVKSKVMFGLTKRQLVCFGTAALIGVPLFFLLRKPAGSSAATLCMIVVMLPFFLLAMYERHGQPLEVIAGQIIQTVFLRPKERPYMTDNFYAAVERQIKTEKEVRRIVQKSKAAAGGGRKAKA